MAFSSSEGKGAFKDWFQSFATPGRVSWEWEPDIKTVLDIGCGAGAYGKIIKEINPNVHVTGVDAFQPYVDQFDLSRYDEIKVCEAKKFLELARLAKDTYDLIIFGDVLEHFMMDKAFIVMSIARELSKFVWVSIPLQYPGKEWYKGYKQEDEEWARNRYEKHEFDIEVPRFKKIYGPFVGEMHFRVVSIFIAEGERI